MLARDSEAVLAYLILYALLCIPVMIYLRRKNAGRKLQIATFVAMTSVVAISVLQRLRLLPTLDGGDVPLALSFLGLLAIMGLFCYQVRSLGAFLLYALALGLMFSYSTLMDFADDRGASKASTTVITYSLGVAVFLLLLGSGILGFRAHFNRRAGGG